MLLFGAMLADPIAVPVDTGGCVGCVGWCVGFGGCCVGGLFLCLSSLSLPSLLCLLPATWPFSPLILRTQPSMSSAWEIPTPVAPVAIATAPIAISEISFLRLCRTGLALAFDGLLEGLPEAAAHLANELALTVSSGCVSAP